MDTVTDLSELVPRVVCERAEIDRLRLFQINRYFESGILVQLPTMLAPDPTIDLSTYFGLYTHDDEIQATARIVRAAAGLPMLEHHPIFPEMLGRLQAAKDSVAEISRLAVGYRHAALSSTCATKPGILAVRAQEPACDSVDCCSREATCTHPQPPLGCPATRYWAFDSLLR